MGRRTGDQTRTLLLRAGMQMLLERGVSAGVQHVRLQDVLRRTGLTSGAAYRLWPDQSAYHRDLAVAMMRMRVIGPTDTIESMIGDLVESGASADDVIQAAALAHVRTTALDMTDPTDLLDAQSSVIALALRTTADTWPELIDASADRHRESVDAFAALCERLIDAYGIRMRDGLTVRDFSEALTALAEGFVIRARTNLEHPTYELSGGEDGMPEGEWTLLGLAIRALAGGFTLPREGDDPSA
ncbi:hypothetical protein AB3M83_13165 [Microbacterium sp. 179-B 1A2 NHS]|uniref:hypothetical protein n=1 Tax=Microbacterium sp. 179-B 1A2 NHS TaxID=3142383 RepID=UPI0039A353AD